MYIQLQRFDLDQYYNHPWGQLLVCSVQSHIDVLPSGDGWIFLWSVLTPCSRKRIDHSIYIRSAELSSVFADICGQGATLRMIVHRKKDRHTQGIEYLSFVYSPSPSFLTGALTRCNVDFNSSFDQRMRKSPMLNTMAPGTGGAGMNTSLLCYSQHSAIRHIVRGRGLTGSSTSKPPTSS